MTRFASSCSDVVCSTIRTFSASVVGFAVCLVAPAMAQLPETFQVTVDKGGGEMVELNLHKHTIRSTDCRILSWDSTNGYVVEHSPTNPGLPARTYRGHLTENPNHVVFAVINEDNTLQAEVHDGSGRLWTISGDDVTAELGNGGSVAPAPAALAAGGGTPVAAGLPGQYLPPVELYRAHGVEDVPSQFFDRNGQSVVQTMVWLEHQWNIFDYFNARDAKLSMELTEVIIRKEQFYFPTAGNAGQFNSMLKTEWDAQGQNARGFIHSWFPYNFTYAGGYASGNEFYGPNLSVSVNALYHEVGHNWRCQHYFYGRETMTGSHPSHGEMNTQRVLYTRQIQIDQNDGIELLTNYRTNVHPRAYTDVATTMVDTAVVLLPLANDYDANGDALSIRSHTTTTAQGGTVTADGDMLTYTPAAGYVGKDVIVYEVEDAPGLYTRGVIHVEVINQGLAAHWNMEDTSGTSASDASGNGHSGAVVGTDFVSGSVQGPVGSALALGSGDYVIGNNSNLIEGYTTDYPLDAPASNFFDPMDQSFTAATWVKLDAASTSATVLSKINAANLGYKITANAGSGFTATVRVWDGLQGQYSVSSGTPLATDAWYHVAMVIDRSDDTLRLYVNGEEVGSAASLPSGFFVFNGREDFKIGGGGAMAVDETSLYSKALTPAEVQALHGVGEVPAAPIQPAPNALGQSLATTLEWLSGQSSYQHDVYFGTDAAAVEAATTASPEYMGRQSATTFDPGALSPSTNYFWRIDEVDGGTLIPGTVWSFSTAANGLVNGLVLHLTMDDADVQVANGVTHTFDDIALPASDFESVDAVAGAPGAIGQAVDLSSSADALRSYATNPVSRPVNGGLTVSFWINTTSTQNGGEKVFDMGGAVFVRFYNGDLQPVFDGSSGGAQIFDANINDGQWHHVVAHNDGAGTTTMWVDGVAIGTQSETIYDIASLGREVSIGATYNSTGENLEALFDDFAVWQRALSTAEIDHIYSEGVAGRGFNAEPVLIDTSFEEGDGFTGFTAGGTSALGTLVDNAGVTWTEVADVDIWNRTDIPPAGVQALTFGLSANLSQVDVEIPGTDHGVGTVSFDYASFSSSSNATLRVLYNDNTGAGWVEAWAGEIVGLNPSFSDKPWRSAEVAVNVPGNVDLRFEMDGDKGGMIDNLRVTGVAINAVPSFTNDPIAGTGGQSGVEYTGTLAGSATDADPLDVLTFSKVTGPAWLVVSADGSLSGTPGLADVGDNAFTVQVEDGNGGSDTATLNISVESGPVTLWGEDFEGAAGSTLGGNWVEVVNDSRIFNTGNGATQMLISVSAGQPIGVVNQLADTFVEGDRYELKWNASRAASANGTLLYEVALGTWDGTTFTPLAGDSGTIAELNLFGKVAGPSVYFTASAAEAGQQIAVRLDVLAGSSDWVGFDDIEVVGLGANSAPSFSVDPIAKADATQDEAYTASIGADAADVDAGDSIAFSKVSGPAWLSVAADGSVSGTPTNGDVGANAFTVRATDEGGLTADATLNVTVLNVNDAPIANDSSGSVAEDAAVGTVVASVAAADIDSSDTLGYAITAGNESGAFAIDSNGNITTAAALDFETTASYALTVTVSDNGTPVLNDTATVTVNVTNVNEAPAASDGSGSLAEDATVGTAVATVAVSDPDAGDSASFAITSGNIGGAFAIDAAGNITTATALDHETASSYALVVTVTDNGGLTDIAAVNVNVTNVNEAPVASDGSGSVAEDAAVGTVVATVAVSDPDAGDSASFAITSGNTGGAFAIDAAGNITTATALDYETTSSYALVVTVTDGGGLTDTAAVNVNVTNVNEAPVASDGSGSLAEDATVGTAVATVAVSDPDASDSASFAITDGNTGGAFAIDAAGNITTATALDYETSSSYALVVTVTDGGGLTDTAAVNVSVTNVNEAPVASDGSGSVAEDATVGTAVATVAVSDPDAGDSASFAITSGNTGGAFAIDSATGAITTAAALDYETTSSYTLGVSVTDGGGLSDAATVTIAVTNVNESPVFASDPIVAADGSTLAAYTGTLAGSASDPDAGDTLSFSKVSGPAWLSVATDGALSGTPGVSDAGLNSFTVEVSDGNGGTAQATLEINVAATSVVLFDDFESYDVENPSDFSVGGTPTGNWTASDTASNATRIFDTTNYGGTRLWISNVDGSSITSSGATVAENTHYTLSAVMVTETGTAGRTLNATYDVLVGQDAASATSIIGGPQAVVTNGDAWQIDDSKEDHVFSQSFQTGALNPGDQLFVRFTRVGVESTGGWFGVDDVMVDTVGANSAPVANDAIFAVAENEAAGTAVGTVTAADADAADTLSYAITAGNEGGEFAIDSATGAITTTAAFDYETAASYALTVTVTDGSAATDTAAVTVNVTDVNEAPVAEDNSGSLAEDATVGAAVATVAASDVDAGSVLSYAITAGNESGAFAIDAGTGAITTAAALDFETTPSYALTVTVTDDGTPALSDTAAVAVTVTNVNEAPVANDGSGSVDENVSVGTVVATATASDVDAGDTLSYAITAGNTGGAFAIDSNSGVITTAGAIDYEAVSSYALTVTVTDAGGLSDTALVSVSVNDIIEVTAPVVATGVASAVTQTSADVAYTISDDGGDAPAVTVYYGEADGGQVAGNWSNSIAQGNQAAGSYNAALTGLTAGTTYYFTVQASNSAGTVWGSSGSFTTVADTSPKLVRTTVSAVSSSTWTTVDLGQSYNSAVIVATPIYPNTSTPPVVTRIRNVSGSSFDLKIDRADGLTGEVTIDVSVIAVEEGVYTQATDGVTMEAVKYTSTVTAENNSWVAEACAYQNSYTNPVVVGQVMSANDASWSVFWSMGDSRQNPVDASNLNVGKHVGEDPNATRADETIGYIVIESGNGTINGVAYEAGLGADNVRGFDNSSTPYTYDLSGTLGSASAAALSISGMDGGDGAWAVLSGSNPITPTTLGLHALEDQMGDSELRHTTTQVGYLVFE
ncbi:cadherin domain-containing protein [Sulfuriroseicoccus oceanibius]|uniref:Cadherin domain-containing protein n=1 Tax=Sulfuriroseicoccus oceanibius TaxID=2707525 RepID=A0A7T7F2H8_9BACT|nr:cadherin domain-containing protein [Sulfuriroseicoccus oceanibius]QQL45498.1 cadherin domain-containing protein [Sulfuriroseicoccus oceanibius]